MFSWNFVRISHRTQIFCWLLIVIFQPLQQDLILLQLFVNFQIKLDFECMQLRVSLTFYFSEQIVQRVSISYTLKILNFKFFLFFFISIISISPIKLIYIWFYFCGKHFNRILCPEYQRNIPTTLQFNFPFFDSLCEY